MNRSDLWRCLTCSALLRTYASAERHAYGHDVFGPDGRVVGHGARLECWTREGRLARGDAALDATGTNV